MKYSVTIQDKSYVVEIFDLNARPVIAYVEGIRFEVIPDTDPVGSGTKTEIKPEIRTVEKPKADTAHSISELTAPLPGTVIEVFVRDGEDIEAGQVLLIIEAMKMKNSIRSTRSGKISEVLVRAGDTVAHKQALVGFEA